MRHIAALAIGALAVVPLLSGCTANYRVDVANGSIMVDRTFWKPMDNPEAFADNFEAREKRLGEEHNQVLTVFKSPIRDDQKDGLEIGPGTWAEFMVLHPPAITLQVRVAHAGHWVMSRQTLSHRASEQASLQTYRPFLSAEESQMLLSAYSDEVAHTRSVLDALVAR